MRTKRAAVGKQMLVVGAGMLLIGFLGAGPVAADPLDGLTGGTTGTTTGTTGTTTGTTGTTTGTTGTTTGTLTSGTLTSGTLTSGTLTSGTLTSGLTGSSTSGSVTETTTGSYYPYDSCSCNYDQWGHRYYDNYVPTTPVYATQVSTVPRGGVNTGDGSFGP